MTHLIYVVDDEQPIRDLLKRTLTKAGFEVATFADGRSALAHLKTTSPSLILLDIRMPGFSGMDFLDAIRLTDPNIPVFMLTSVFDVESTRTAVCKGARDYLQKPFDLNYLVSYVNSYLNKFAAAA